MGAEKTVQIIYEIQNGGKRFDPTFVSQLTKLKLSHDAAAWASYQSTVPKPLFSGMQVFQGSGDSPSRETILTINQHSPVVTLAQVVKTFGAPSETNDTPPSKVVYYTPWGTMIFYFNQHGFMSLKEIVLNEHFGKGK